MRLLTVTEIAEKLNVSKSQVYNLRDRGMLPPHVKLGGCVRWQSDLIDAWIADGVPDLREGKEVAKAS